MTVGKIPIFCRAINRGKKRSKDNLCDIDTLTNNAVRELTNTTKFTNQWCMLITAIVNSQPIVWTMLRTRSNFTHWTCHYIFTTDNQWKKIKCKKKLKQIPKIVSFNGNVAIKSQVLYSIMKCDINILFVMAEIMAIFIYKQSDLF